MNKSTKSSTPGPKEKAPRNNSGSSKKVHGHVDKKDNRHHHVLEKPKYPQTDETDPFSKESWVY